MNYGIFFPWTNSPLSRNMQSSVQKSNSKEQQNRQPTGICCMAQETQTGALFQPRGVGWEGDESEALKEGDICLPMAESC